MESVHRSATEQCGTLAAGGEVPPFSSPAAASPTPRQKGRFFSASAAATARGVDAGEEGLCPRALEGDVPTGVRSGRRH
jgi:hypothetical protein